MKQFPLLSGPSFAKQLWKCALLCYSWKLTFFLTLTLMHLHSGLQQILFLCKHRRAGEHMQIYLYQLWKLFFFFCKQFVFHVLLVQKCYLQIELPQAGTTASTLKTCPSHHYQASWFFHYYLHKLLCLCDKCTRARHRNFQKSNIKGSQHSNGKCIPRQIMYYSVLALVFVSVIHTCCDVVLEKSFAKTRADILSM